MTHLFAILGLGAACAAWLLVQRLTGRTPSACCGLREPEAASADCADCPERRRRERAASGAALLAVLLLAGGGCAGGSAPDSAKSAEDAPGPRQHGERTLMGTRFAIEIESDDAEGARAAIEAAFAEVARVEALLSEWREDSEISEVNRQAGQDPVRVGPEMLEVSLRAREISELTNGAFDVTFAPCWEVWDFRRERVPSDVALDACSELVDWRWLEIDEEASTLRLTRRAMKMGISGIGKGYGVDRAAAVLEERGFDRRLVDGGGDVRLNGRPWVMGIAHPRSPGALLGKVEVSEGAIVTSGDYYRYFEKDGVRYHHILDPRNGRTARGCIAVTVIAPDATQADALATGLFVMGADKGLALVESLAGIEALFVLPDLTQRRSSGFPELQPVR